MAARKSSPAVKAAIVQSVTNGAYAKHAAVAAGITEQALYRWIEADAEFALAIDRARSAALMKSVQVLHSSDDWRAHERYLARCGNGEFMERTGVEHSGTLSLAEVLAPALEDAEDAF